MESITSAIDNLNIKEKFEIPGDELVKLVEGVSKDVYRGFTENYIIPYFKLTFKNLSEEELSELKAAICNKITRNKPNDLADYLELISLCFYNITINDSDRKYLYINAYTKLSKLTGEDPKCSWFIGRGAGKERLGKMCGKTLSSNTPVCGKHKAQYEKELKKEKDHKPIAKPNIKLRASRKSVTKDEPVDDNNDNTGLIFTKQ